MVLALALLVDSISFFALFTNSFFAFLALSVTNRVANLIHDHLCTLKIPNRDNQASSRVSLLNL